MKIYLDKIYVVGGVVFKADNEFFKNLGIKEGEEIDLGDAREATEKECSFYIWANSLNMPEVRSVELDAMHLYEKYLLELN